MIVLLIFLVVLAYLSVGAFMNGRYGNEPDEGVFYLVLFIWPIILVINFLEFVWKIGIFFE